MTDHQYRDARRQAAAAWKQRTDVLPEPAREPAQYVGKEGRAGGPLLDFCLPAAFAEHNLHPEIRDEALGLFRDLGIPWHAGIGTGPGNHLLSSQVQCVNALTPMVRRTAPLATAFGHDVDVDEVLEVEPGRHVTFEYIGPTDYFGEAPGGERVRGAHCTSVDAAFRFRAGDGRVELALVEWKLTEDYRRPGPPDPAKDEVRRERYLAAWEDPDGPLRTDVIPFDDMLVEPFYQLMRQQLLAAALERDPAVDADVVRVLHVLPPGNAAYQQSLTHDSHRQAGATVSEVWRSLLRRPDRFVSIHPGVFCEPAVTSPTYVDRYSETLPEGADPAEEFDEVYWDQMADRDELRLLTKAELIAWGEEQGCELDRSGTKEQVIDDLLPYL